MINLLQLNNLNDVSDTKKNLKDQYIIIIELKGHRG